MGIEIVYKVKSDCSNHVRYVLSRLPKYEYTKRGDYIEGTDGIFYDCYIYNRIGGAFGGSKFTLKLKTGEIVNCDGHWFSGGHGNVKVPLVSIGIGTVDELKRCYVFQSAYVDPWKLKCLPGFDSNFSYEYNDFEKVIKYDRLMKERIKADKDKKVLIKEIQKKHKVLNYILDQYNKKLKLK